MKNMEDYHNLHLKSDVLLLADVFEQFRNSSLKNHELCSGHYLGARLKVELEIISDTNI